MIRIESFLSSRLFLQPQTAGGKIYYMSNLSGHISLYRMDLAGSVPEPLLPSNIALQNPHLIEGYSYYIFPSINKILLMIDQDGDENYQPALIPLEGGFPVMAYQEALVDQRLFLLNCDPVANMAYFNSESNSSSIHQALRVNLVTNEVEILGESKWGAYVDGVTEDHSKLIMTDGYTAGDNVLYLWNKESGRELLVGVPLAERKPEEPLPLNSINSSTFTHQNEGLLFSTTLFNDRGGLGFLWLKSPKDIQPVHIKGEIHQGIGELTGLKHLGNNHYFVIYNIDGCSWVYAGLFDEKNREMQLEKVIVGKGVLEGGVLESVFYEKATGVISLSFSTATSPTQLFTYIGDRPKPFTQITAEKILGISAKLLAPGEDSSFDSYDRTRISARLYLPATELGFTGKRPVVYYIHGGPQSQERPDFAWFSMPLIEFLTLKGFAVFVPNVRGSSGYGLKYMKQVDRDWGGNDRLDHIHAMTEVLPRDTRLDVSRTGVVGRSYGGFMSLTLASRHPELWSAAVDMFGPYNLLTFMERIPETWKPYFQMAVGDPLKDLDFLVERSPSTHLDRLTCPLLVIQGKNDPRVIERESRDVVEKLRQAQKEVSYLVFENEGHDVLKYENRATCYNTITDFFTKYLTP